MFTNKCTELGWMDTLQIAEVSKLAGPNFDSKADCPAPQTVHGSARLPPAYLTGTTCVSSSTNSLLGYRTITTGGAPKILLGPYGYKNHITGNVPDG